MRNFDILDRLMRGKVREGLEYFFSTENDTPFRIEKKNEFINSLTEYVTERVKGNSKIKFPEF